MNGRDAPLDPFPTPRLACDETTAAAVFNQFAGRLLQLAQRRLRDAVRSKIDPEDVLQSVFRSFCTRWRDGELEIASWDSLWGLLTVLTLRKCTRKVRHFSAAQRDVGREAGLRPADEAHVRWASSGPEPTPLEAAVLTDILEQLMRGLEPPDREILTLHLQGYTYHETGEQVGCAARTVRRVIDRVRRRLRRMQECDKSFPDEEAS